MSYPPRDGDLPREELVRRAQDVIDEYLGRGQPISTYFKFTCPYCGERCMLSEPNVLYETVNAAPAANPAPSTWAGSLFTRC